ncbi:MAG: nucleoside:proton symporter [Proteobacteria bacterium ST_bin14]|nr:MAG: nucleoside:proton symporter [Proteobacteria bacterium ST_bin14]
MEAGLLPNVRSLVGLLVIIIVCAALSERRGTLPGWRWIAGAIGLQFVLAVVLVKAPPVWAALSVANDGLSVLQTATDKGSRYIFGYLAGGDQPFAAKPGAPQPFIIAFQILPLVIVTSALAALLWHWGVLKQVAKGLGWMLERTLGIGGAVALNAGGNVFLGVVEAPMIIRAYLIHMSRAELFAVMVLGMSTVSGVVLVLYSQTLKLVVDNAFGHIITASLICLPASLLIARLLVPGDEATPADRTDQDLTYDNSIDAIIRGTMDGMQLFLAIIAVLIVVFALVALTDSVLGLAPDIWGAPLTLQRLFGWIFAPLMWLLGVPWADAQTAGSLMGTKAILNEYVAYQQMAALGPDALSPRGKLVTLYALCGFANLASIGLGVSTLSTLCPARRGEIAALGFKSWFAGNLATMMVGAVIGVLTISA